jgi:hypothetical protein
MRRVEGWGSSGQGYISGVGLVGRSGSGFSFGWVDWTGWCWRLGLC